MHAQGAIPMPVLDHTIVTAHDKQRSASFVADVLGLPAPIELGHFAVVRVGEITTLDFAEIDGPVTSQHYAFLVTEAEFDDIFGRIRSRHCPYWADPQHRVPDRINTWDGGRGVYFDDPSGHLLEVITRSYGSGGSTTSNIHPLFARPRD